VVSLCLGARSPDQVTGNLRLASAAVPVELWDELREQGLLRLDAPVPRDDERISGP
jgi:D-threo-aldose 1-dehydrogenase